MLGKLIKHDFKSLSRILLPTQIAILGATIIATLGFMFNLKIDYSASGVQLLRMITSFLSAIMLLAIIAASFLIAFIIFQRFYKNLMSDEGYLTFTLPVTTTEILWSKLITAMIWSLISGVVIFICINIFVLFGTSQSGIVNFEIYREMSKIINDVFATIGPRVLWPILELFLISIVSLAFSILHVYLALIIGSIVSQKHKILAGIGFYFVISMAVSVLSTIAQFFLGGAMINEIERLNGIHWGIHGALDIYNIIFSAMQPFYWFYLLFTVALTAVFFYLCKYFLSNKLNLE